MYLRSFGRRYNLLWIGISTEQKKMKIDEDLILVGNLTNTVIQQKKNQRTVIMLIKIS